MSRDQGPPPAMADSGRTRVVAESRHPGLTVPGDEGSEIAYEIMGSSR